MLLLRPAALVVTLTAGVAIALAHASGLVEAGGGACHPGNPIVDEHATTVVMSSNCFGPTIARIDEGATVTFVNKDLAMHNVTGAAYSWRSPADLLTGDSVEHTFNETGVYPYACTLHPGMVGAIVVGNVNDPDAAAAGSVRSSPLRLASSGPRDAADGNRSGLSASSDGVVAGRAIAIAAAVALAVAIGVAFATRRWIMRHAQPR